MDEELTDSAQRRGFGLRHVLALAWALLIGALGVIVLWTHLGRPPPGQVQEAIRVPLPPVPTVAAIATPVEPGPAAEVDTKAPAPVEPAFSATGIAAAAPDAAAATQAASVEAPAAPPLPPVAQPAPADSPPPAQLAAARPLPTAREATAPAWIRNARPFDENDRRPRIAFVISKLGLESAPTSAAIHQLPGEVTLAFSAYADRLDHWVGLARAAGHEVLLNLPMEPINFPADDPGPRALLTSLGTPQNLERLDWVLARADGYIGVMNQMGSRFTAAPEALKPVLTALNERGLLFLDSRTTPRSVAAKLASDIGLPRAIVDRWVDNEASRPAIDVRLGEIERIARETGSAVAMGQPYPITIERVAAWLPTLETKGFVISPLSAVANRQADR